MKILIQHATVVDGATNLAKECDILVKDGIISAIAKDIKETADQTINAQNKVVMPGIIDMHVHLREPGREDKETIASGTAAALKGGVTSVLAMPNTQPSIDNAKAARLLRSLIVKTAQANVFMAGAITVERKGRKLAAISALKKEGIVAITDDGASVDDPGLLLQALKLAKKNKVTVICHCEDKGLSRNGVVNRGVTSTVLGLRGIPTEAEYKRVERDIALAEKAGASIHIAHVSCKESIDCIARAKKRGVNVSAETAPHYFALDETELLSYDTNKKINPPLRTKADVEAIKQGLKNGIIDVIASDHAPHTDNEKDIEFDHAEFGAIGLETELAVSITELIKPGILDWPQLVRALCWNPAKILGLKRGALREGAAADIIIVDPNKEWIVQRKNLISKSKNSCFLGKKLFGCVEYTIVNGKIAYKP